MKCVIPCAGRSTRMGLGIPKPLLKVGDRTLLECVMEPWVGLVDGFVVVASKENRVEIEALGWSQVEVVVQSEPRGLADAIFQARGLVTGRFIITLGDCLYRGKWEGESLESGIGVLRYFGDDEFRKSYAVSVDTDSGNVKRVTEKPKSESGGWCGMGTYFMDEGVFSYIRAASVKQGGGDFTEIIQDMIGFGEKIKPVWFVGEYVNVTYPEDLDVARRILSGQAQKVGS